MTWLLSEVSELIAVAYSVRSTLKMLKHLSNVNQDSSGADGKENIHKLKSIKDIENESRGVLMFWSVFALYMMWERHVEFLIRWFPGYYYLKSFFIVIIAIPKLKIINLVFNDLVVPILEYLHKYIGKHEIPSASQFILSLPIYILLLCFPSIINDDTSDKVTPDESDDIIEINRIGSQYDDYDENELMKEGNEQQGKSIIESSVIEEEINYHKTCSPNGKSTNSAPYCVLYDDHMVDDDDIIKVKVRESSRRLSTLLPMIKQIETIETPAKPGTVTNRRQSLQSVYNFAKKLSPTKFLSPSKLKSMVSSSIQLSSSKSTPIKATNVNLDGSMNVATPTRSVPNTSSKVMTPKSPIQDMSKAVVNTVRSVLNGGDYKNSIFNIHNPSSNSVIRDKRRQTLMLKSSSDLSRTKSYQSPTLKSSASSTPPSTRYDTPKAAGEAKRSPSPPSSITTRKRKSVKSAL